MGNILRTEGREEYRGVQGEAGGEQGAGGLQGEDGGRGVRE